MEFQNLSKDNAVEQSDTPVTFSAAVKIISNPRHQAMLILERFGTHWVPRHCTVLLAPILTHPNLKFSTTYANLRAEGIVVYSMYVMDNLDQVKTILKEKKF